MRSSTQSSVNSTQATYRRFLRHLSSKASPARSREWVLTDDHMRNHLFTRKLQGNVQFLKPAINDLEDVEVQASCSIIDERINASKRRLLETTDILEKEILKRNETIKKQIMDFTGKYRTKFPKKMSAPHLPATPTAPQPPTKLAQFPQTSQHKVSRSLLIERNSIKLKQAQRGSCKQYLKTQTNFGTMMEPQRPLICRNPESVFKFEPPQLPERIPIETRKSALKHTLKITSKLAWMFDHRRRLQIVNLKEGRRGEALSVLPWGSFVDI